MRVGCASGATASDASTVNATVAATVTTASPPASQAAARRGSDPRRGRSATRSTMLHPIVSSMSAAIPHDHSTR